MFSQLLSIRLAVSLILLISGQWTSARPQNPYYVENGGHGYSHHHRHHGHHEHGPGFGPGSNGPPPFALGRFPPPPPFYPDNQPSGGRQPYYPNGGAVQGQPGGQFHQHGAGFHRGQQEYPHPVGDFNRGHPGLQQPGGDFNRRQPGFQQPGNEFNRAQPGGRAPGHQQPGSNELPTYPRGSDRQQPGGDANTLQPRPGQNSVGFQQPNENSGGFPSQPGKNSGGFQQPGQNSGGFRQPSQSSGGFQKPGQNSGGFQQPGQNSGGFQQPGQNSGGFQQPGQNSGEFQQPGFNQGPRPGTSNNFIEPRPISSDEDFSSFNFQSPKSLQPRPGTSNKPIEPRPISSDAYFSSFNFQSPKTLQPRPGQDHETGVSGEGQTIQPIPGQQQPSVIQPIPGKAQYPDNVGQNINDLFNTQDFLSPDLSRAPGSNRDPKSDAEEANPESVNERSLFNLDPKCAEGLKVMAGRCRKEA
ncbi:glutenin, high molecular weight subunit DY10 [Drosophila teissieri]|uniref:glutenin, high molecular weight subunit DY10 n=1 Tax=Drosophila teissieri TaxID=7243 RepID=UPI001CBA301F|nr:glutenin, high molecular weight subunit DY10 [Drosophila teissieri]